MSGIGEARTAAVLLGAAEFRAHEFENSPQFLQSKDDFKDYLTDQDRGMGMPAEAVLDLFGSLRNSSDQLVEIGEFLDSLTTRYSSFSSRNLIVYYVGHGFFPGARQEYHIAIAGTRLGFETTTSLRIASLADVLKEKARAWRRFVILDCCFAAEALKEFQGPIEDAIARKADSAFEEHGPRRQVEVPRRGTALLCAADKDSVARVLKQHRRTMFSNSFMHVLRRGDSSYPADLTLEHATELAWEHLRDQYAQPVRPVLHSPDQSEGDIAKTVVLFPNPARRPTPHDAAPSQGIGTADTSRIGQHARLVADAEKRAEEPANVSSAKKDVAVPTPSQQVADNSETQQQTPAESASPLSDALLERGVMGRMRIWDRAWRSENASNDDQSYRRFAIGFAVALIAAGALVAVVVFAPSPSQNPQVPGKSTASPASDAEVLPNAGSAVSKSGPEVSEAPPTMSPPKTDGATAIATPIAEDRDRVSAVSPAASGHGEKPTIQSTLRKDSKAAAEKGLAPPNAAQKESVGPGLPTPILSTKDKDAINREIIVHLPALSKMELVLVTGHVTNGNFSQQFAQKRSEQYADAVRNYLISNGVARDKIETLGMGKTQPVPGVSSGGSGSTRTEVEVKGETSDGRKVTYASRVTFGQ